MEGMSPSDVAMLARDGDGFGGNSWFGMIIVLFFLVYGMNGGGWGNRGFDNAIGYENLATSNEVQRGFDNQNSMANQRDILAAVNAGTAQSVATSNQVFHDMMAYTGDKYSELQRDIAALGVGQANSLAKMNECCCSIQRGLDGVNYNTTEQAQRIIDAITGNRMADMQNQINQLQMEQAMRGVVRYPDSFTYSAGNNPFCGCNGFNI